MLSVFTSLYLAMILLLHGWRSDAGPDDDCFVPFLPFSHRYHPADSQGQVSHTRLISDQRSNFSLYGIPALAGLVEGRTMLLGIVRPTCLR